MCIFFKQNDLYQDYFKKQFAYAYVYNAATLNVKPL